MLAVVGFEVGLLVTTRTASVLSFALGGVYHGGRYDACGHSNNGVTKYHDDAREETSQDGDRGDVAIPNCGERNDSPIDAGADVSELRVGVSSFDHKHECAENDDKDEDEEEIDEYLAETEFDALHEEVALIDEGEKLEHPEDADESEYTQDEKVTCAGQGWNEG